MNVQLLCELARIRSDDLIRQAALARAARSDSRLTHPLRREVGRAISALGETIVTLGQSLAQL